MVEGTKITKRTVDALKVETERYVVWDTEVAGFGVRVGPSGKVYVFRYRVGGGRAGRVRLGTLGRHGALTPDQARAIARDWAAQVAAGGDPAGEKIGKRLAPTVAELMAEYLRRHVELQNKLSTRAYVTDIVNRIVLPGALSRLKVTDATEADVARFLGRLVDTPTTANRVRSALSTAFSLAETWGYRPRGTNPVSPVQKLRETARERFLSPAEFAALGEALAKAERGELTETVDGVTRTVFVSRWAAAAIRLLIFTGARRGEVLGLRWEWIAWDAGRADLPDSKTGRKTLMLPPAALEVLRGLERPASGRGFVIRGGDYSDPERPLVNLKDPWGVVRRAAGIPDVRLHDLRHSFASTMVAGGASLPVIGALLGHRDVKTTARYAHLASDPLKAAADHVGGVIAGHLSGPEGGAEVVSLPKKR